MLDVELAIRDKFVVPFLSEAVDEGLSQELIDADALATAQHLGALADFPAVVVDDGAVGMHLDACRIEVAGDGFAPTDAPSAVGLLDGA